MTRPKPTDPQRLFVANDVLASFSHETTIERRCTGWFVIWHSHYGNHARRWQCRGNDFYPVWHRHWAHGGTATTALSQLIRWNQFRPVLPIATWRMWAGERCRLLPQSAVDLLAKGGYPDVAQCVLCNGDLTASTGLDWWHLDKVSGPCCSFRGGCRQQQRETT